MLFQWYFIIMVLSKRAKYRFRRSIAPRLQASHMTSPKRHEGEPRAGSSAHRHHIDIDYRILTASENERRHIRRGAVALTRWTTIHQPYQCSGPPVVVVAL